MERKCLLSELDEVMEALQEEDIFAEEFIIEEEEGEYAIFVTALKIVIPSLGLELREGYCGQWQEDDEYYMADFSLTAVYEKGAVPESFLMWEQDSPLVTLYNYTHKPLDELEALECVVVLEE